MNLELALELAEALCIRWEQLVLKPYLCPAGVPTIGVGATYYANGRKVSLADPPITKEQALELLRWMLRQEYLPAVLKLCPRVDTPGRLAALLDFTFNLGAANLKTSSLRRKVNGGRWDEVPAKLRKWIYVSGKPLRGLRLRREAEILLLAL